MCSAGVRRVAFLGLAKNVGKTTALVAVLRELHRRRILVGTTSAGRDGEDFDALTGEPKPSFHVWPNQIVVSADSSLSASTLAATVLERLPIATRFGSLVVARVRDEGRLEMIGPTTAAQTARVAETLETYGAQMVLLDGAFGRRAFASARVADGVVLAVGMAAGRTLEHVLERARAAVQLISLERPPEGRPHRIFDGALTDEILHERPPRPGETLVASDFASIFLSTDERRRLASMDVTLAVERPTRLLALTANPSSPGGGKLPPGEFLEALAACLPDVPAFDLEADLSRLPGAQAETGPT